MIKKKKQKKKQKNEKRIPTGNFFKYVSTDFCRMNGFGTLPPSPPSLLRRTRGI
jgi:hypothetical protein